MKLYFRNNNNNKNRMDDIQDIKIMYTLYLVGTHLCISGLFLLLNPPRMLLHTDNVRHLHILHQWCSVWRFERYHWNCEEWIGFPNSTQVLYYKRQVYENSLPNYCNQCRAVSFSSTHFWRLHWCQIQMYSSTQWMSLIQGRRLFQVMLW